MLKQIAIFLLLTLIHCKTVVMSSTITTTSATAPNGKRVAVQIYNSKSKLPSVGQGAQWIWHSNSTNWPADQIVHHQSIFQSYCVGPATLTVAGNTPFNVRLAGKEVGESESGNQTKTFKVNLDCDYFIRLSVNAKNRHNGLDGAISYQLTQDQSHCFKCADPKGYYNLKTCRCECKVRCRCGRYPRYLRSWKNYPICACQCNTQKRDCSPLTHYFDEGRCRCVCRRRVCGKNEEQDRQTCKCRKQQ